MVQIVSSSNRQGANAPCTPFSLPLFPALDLAPTPSCRDPSVIVIVINIIIIREAKKEGEHQEPEGFQAGGHSGCHRVHRVLQYETAEGASGVSITRKVQAPESEGNLSGRDAVGEHHGKEG